MNCYHFAWCKASISEKREVELTQQLAALQAESAKLTRQLQAGPDEPRKTGIAKDIHEFSNIRICQFNQIQIFKTNYT